MSSNAESRRSQKIGKLSHRLSPHLPSKRGRNKAETSPLSTGKSIRNAREQNSNVRGNVVQDIWVATQKTIRMIKAEGLNKEQGNIRATDCPGIDKAHISGKDWLTSSTSSASRRSGQTGSMERRNHFHLVMKELKFRSRLRQGGKEHIVHSKVDLNSSPTAIQGLPSSGRINEVHGDRILLEPLGNSARNTPTLEASGSAKSWLPRTQMVQKSTSTPEVEAGINEEGISSKKNCTDQPWTITGLPGLSSICDGYEFVPSYHITRRHGRIHEKKWSEGTLKKGFLAQYDSPISFKFHDEHTGDPLDSSLDVQNRLLKEVRELLRVMDESENSLMNLRVKTERNSCDLRSEIRQLNQLIVSMTQTQELHFHRLLDSLQENCRTLAQVESGFDYFLSLMNRQKRYSFGSRPSRWVLFLLDHTVASILTLVYVFSSIYTHFRSKEMGRTRHVGS